MLCIALVYHTGFRLVRLAWRATGKLGNSGSHVCDLAKPPQIFGITCSLASRLMSHAFRISERRSLLSHSETRPYMDMGILQNFGDRGYYHWEELLASRELSGVSTPVSCSWRD